jgi:aerobic-type carbon monoxide dehydrogenase small subunit (CoxS/CutS family)
MTTSQRPPAAPAAHAVPRGLQRPVKAAADELIDVSFTVNGTPVTIQVAARVHLGDALRTNLGLSGTHLGCEHGVCGMCTVLIDGDAARACLVFAVQAEGTDIVTVEGLGTQEAQHPLQQAFSHHHALQCGFCTPGFLMSSYDLLTHNEGALDAETLPEEMSGVLCRCTGYRGILEAVTDVAEAHPDGIPAPLNCAPRTLVGRGGGAPTAASSPGPAEVADEAEDAPAELVRPTGTPTLTVQVTRQLSSPVDDVWAVMDDVDRLARCLPGAEMTADLGDDRYRGRAKVSLGPVRRVHRAAGRRRRLPVRPDRPVRPRPGRRRQPAAVRAVRRRRGRDRPHRHRTGRGGRTQCPGDRRPGDGGRGPPAAGAAPYRCTQREGTPQPVAAQSPDGVVTAWRRPGSQVHWRRCLRGRRQHLLGPGERPLSPTAGRLAAGQRRRRRRPRARALTLAARPARGDDRP